jgi:hypothetical protein
MVMCVYLNINLYQGETYYECLSSVTILRVDEWVQSVLELLSMVLDVQCAVQNQAFFENKKVRFLRIVFKTGA